MRRFSALAAAWLFTALALQPVVSRAQDRASDPAAALFVVIYRSGPAWQQGRPLSEQGLRPHGSYVRGLLDRGRLFAGGGFGEGDGGMMILRVADRAEAEAIVAADPAVTSGVFVAEIRSWLPRFRADGPLPTPAGLN